MKKLILIRDNKTPNVTFGTLYVVEQTEGESGEFIKKIAEFESLELPWKDNKRNISCIPAGTYSAYKWISPTHGKCIRLSGVPGRTNILIHPGNRVSETRGCIFPGKDLGYFDGETGVIFSRAALNEILKLLPDNTTIEIRDE